VKYKGKKVIILKGQQKGLEGYVTHEDSDSIAIRLPELVGAEGHYEMAYARKEDVIISC